MKAKGVTRPVLYTASEARSHFYSLLKDASMGVVTYEITNKFGDAAVLLSKDEYDSWRETLDILNDHQETTDILRARNEQTTYSHADVLKQLKLNV